MAWVKRKIQFGLKNYGTRSSWHSVAEKTFAIDHITDFLRKKLLQIWAKKRKNRKTFFRKHFLPLKYP